MNDMLPTTKTAFEYAQKLREDFAQGKNEWCIALRLIHFYEDFDKAIKAVVLERKSA